MSIRSRLATPALVVLTATALAVPTGQQASAEPVVAAAEVTNGCVDSVPEPDTTTPVKICYTLFKPAGASADAQVPMILHSHGWAGSRTRSEAAVQPWLDAGFGVLSFDQRAHGESTGVAHVMNPAFEGKDVVKIVDLIAGLDWVEQERRGDPVLGSVGGSYGGGFQFAGAFTELQEHGRTRFDALAPEITWWDLKQSLAPDNIPRAWWLQLLYASGGHRLPPEMQRLFQTYLVQGRWPDGEDGKLADAFFAKNGPAWHVSQGRRLDIPVLLGQGLTDNLFPLQQGLRNFDRALTRKARSQSMLVGYNGGHTLPSNLPPGFGTPGDPCSQALGSASFRDLSIRFMQLRLQGENTGLTGFGRYHLATADGSRCVSERHLFPNAVRRLDPLVSTSAAGQPFAVKVADGPITLAGPAYLSARVRSLAPGSRAFFALSVGNTAADAKIIQNNSVPMHEPIPVSRAQRLLELAATAVAVPAGQSLFLTVSPIADMYGGAAGPAPGELRLDHVRLFLHRVG